MQCAVTFACYFFSYPFLIEILRLLFFLFWFRFPPSGSNKNNMIEGEKNETKSQTTITTTVTTKKCSKRMKQLLYIYIYFNLCRLVYKSSAYNKFSRIERETHTHTEQHSQLIHLREKFRSTFWTRAAFKHSIGIVRRTFKTYSIRLCKSAELISNAIKTGYKLPSISERIQ